MKLTIRAKLIAGFSVLLAMLAVSAVVSIQKLSAINGQLNRIVDYNAARVQHAGDMRTAMLMMGRAEKNMILEESIEEMKRRAENIDRYAGMMGQSRAKFESLTDDAGREMLKQFDAH